MCTTTKQLEADMCHVQSSWILSPELWTASVLGPLGSYSALTTSCLGRPEQAIIGPRDIILKARSSSTLSLMLFVRKLRDAIAFKASNFATVLEAELVLAWALCSSQRFVKSTQTVSWRRSL